MLIYSIFLQFSETIEKKLCINKMLDEYKLRQDNRIDTVNYLCKTSVFIKNTLPGLTKGQMPYNFNKMTAEKRM